jgi:tRNA pseudouridine-54 N-methylase
LKKINKDHRDSSKGILKEDQEIKEKEKDLSRKTETILMKENGESLSHSNNISDSLSVLKIKGCVFPEFFFVGE